MPFRRSAVAGESLLELLMSLAIFSAVVVVFATVFPGGYRLNQTNLRESKATHLTTAVVDELLNMPFTELELMVDGAAGGGWPANTTRFALFPAAVDGIDFQRVSAGELPKKPRIYYLPEKSLPVGSTSPTINKGIKVTVKEEKLPAFVDPLQPAFEPLLKIADIEVAIYWYEARNNALELRSLSVQAARPSNLINQRGY